jgi:ribosome-associated protein
VDNYTLNKIINEADFSTSRSSGPGGQNVNKVSSKVELRFNIEQSQFLSDEEKSTINRKLINKINSSGELILTCQVSRSQLANKEKVIEKFIALILKALTPPIPRKATKPTRASIEKRIEQKKILSEKKSYRKKLD